MRRPEWLVVPLLLLPVIGFAAFLLYARHDYRSLVRPYREDGAAVARAWLAESPERAAALLGRFETDYAPGTPGVPGPEERIVLRVDGWEVVVRRPAGLPAAPWTFTRRAPAGLAPAALADPEVRLAVETGRPPIQAGAVDDGSIALAALLASPDLDRLRTAPLPPAAKAWLLRRWGDAGFPPEAAAGAEAVVAAATALLGAGLPPADPAPGLHRAGALALLVSNGAWPPAAVPAAELPPRTPVLVHETADGLARLHAGGRPAGDVAFAGRLDAPVAQDYALVMPHGDRWWRGPVFVRGAPLAGAAALLLLLLPASLLVSLVRRRRLDEARARFITELAHDLRTPLTSLRLHAELLAADRAPEGERRRYVETMARESERLTGVLANLLDLPRLERGAREFAAARVEVRPAVEEAVREFGAIHRTRAADVTTGGPAGAAVRGDPAALARCLSNLLDNAGKYTPAGTPIRVEWGAVDDRRIRLRVSDEGPGVPAGERALLFRRYERGAAAKRDGVPGTGLGLSLVRELAEGMGGAARHVGNGSGAAFEIELPEATDE